jgi:3-deoxy-D-manno-octulosonic-acid transferase
MSKEQTSLNNSGESNRDVLPNRGVFLLLYNFFLSLYSAAIRVYSLFNGKAKKWVDGRVGWQAQMTSVLKPNEQRIWIHCSSIGEFEQALPVVEALKANIPGIK